MFNKCKECGKDLGRNITCISISPSVLFEYHVEKAGLNPEDFGNMLWNACNRLYPVCDTCMENNRYYRVPETDEEKEFINKHIGVEVYKTSKPKEVPNFDGNGKSKSKV